ncbi:MAG: type II toxin-antitoxin system HicA family toxin [Oscillospiraceae bacterium]|nr:type II toxin-antitoxin system HicA family toxin [Oscillospiraceae bacterium]
MKVSELIRLAKKHGCRLERHGAEHDIWINPKTGITAQISRHPSKEVRTGTAEKIKKDLGLK